MCILNRKKKVQSGIVREIEGRFVEIEDVEWKMVINGNNIVHVVST